MDAVPCQTASCPRVHNLEVLACGTHKDEPARAMGWCGRGRGGTRGHRIPARVRGGGGLGVGRMGGLGSGVCGGLRSGVDSCVELGWIGWFESLLLDWLVGNPFAGLGGWKPICWIGWLETHLLDWVIGNPFAGLGDWKPIEERGGKLRRAWVRRRMRGCRVGCAEVCRACP